MSKSDPVDGSNSEQPKRRRFTKEFKEEAVQMLLDGHSATSVADRLGLSGAGVLYRWKRDLIGQAGKLPAQPEAPQWSGCRSRRRELHRSPRKLQGERDLYDS